MTSKFDSSFLENCPRSSSFKTAEENVYFDTEETLGGEYCGLTPSDLTFPRNTTQIHSSTSGYDNQGENSISKNERENISVRNHRSQNATLQNAASTNIEDLQFSSSKRSDQSRLASDNQVFYGPMNYGNPEVRNLERINSSSISVFPQSTVRIQPNITSFRNRTFEDLPSNTRNEVIMNQPKLGMLLPREPVSGRTHEDKLKRKGLSNTLESSSRGPPPEPDSNENHLRTDKWQRKVKTKHGHEKSRPIVHKQTSKEGPVFGQSDKSLQYRGGKIPHTPSDRSAEVSSTNDDTTKETQIPPAPCLAQRNDQNEITSMSMAPICMLPRIRELRQETPAKKPVITLPFSRPYLFDVQGKTKTKVLKTFSSPEIGDRGGNHEEIIGVRNDFCEVNERNPQKPKHDDEYYNQFENQMSHQSPKRIAKLKGKRSKSLPVSTNMRSLGRRGPAATEANPLRYFGYLGRRFQFRERLLSTHNALSARPVILTSTSVISPEVTTNFCQQLTDQGPDPCNDSVKQQGVCVDLIDCCTCMCCVNALFYHCTKDDEGEVQYSEHPCSCIGPAGSCLCRWSVLGMLSLVMPCILCYLPIHGCMLGVEYLRKSSTSDSEQ